MYCIYCGKQIKDTAKFCTFCGARMDEEEDKTEVILPAEDTDKTEVILPEAVAPTPVVSSAEDKTELLVTPEPVVTPVEDKTDLLVETDETEVLVDTPQASTAFGGNQPMQIRRPLKYMGHVIDEATVSQMMAAKEKTMKKKAGGMLGLMLFLLVVVLVVGAWGIYAYYLKNNI